MNMSDFKKFKEQLPSKEKFCSSLTGKKISNKDYEFVLKILNKFEMKTTFYCQLIHMKKFRNNSLKNSGLSPSPEYQFQVGMQCLILQKFSLNLLQILICIYSLKKICGTEFNIFLIDIAKANNKYYVNLNLMTQNKNQNI